ncbi:MAG: carbon starvation CstA family protein, partial [Planctomycetota bacterium]
VQWDPADAPMIFPFLFITIACGAISGFHCLVSSGTSSKQLKNEKDAQFVGFGSMLTEGFLATLVILACCAGLGLGVGKQVGGVLSDTQQDELGLPEPTIVRQYLLHSSNAINSGVVVSDQWIGFIDEDKIFSRDPDSATLIAKEGIWIAPGLPYISSSGEYQSNPSHIPILVHYVSGPEAALIGSTAWQARYGSWNTAQGLPNKVAAFVDGSANFLKAMGIPAGIAVALMGVLVASFAGTTLDTACRLQRYVVQELARTLLPKPGPKDCPACGYDLTGNTSGTCPECGADVSDASAQDAPRLPLHVSLMNPLTWLTNKHGATIFAILTAAAIAAMPAPGSEWSLANAGKGGLILWPMFGATNQLLGGLAFLVITFYLWRRGKAVWFVVLPLAFMIVVPAWAMVLQLAGWLPALPDKETWLAAWLAYPAVFFREANWVLVIMAVATLVLEAWMLVEAALLFPKARGVLEEGGEAMPG